MFLGQKKQIARLAMTRGLLSVFPRNENVKALGLMSYGATLADMYLVINLKTAKALGLTIPQSLMLRADHVI